MRSLTLLLLLFASAAFGQTYPWLPPALSGTYYSYNLPTGNLILGTPALTQDMGMLYWNGTTWQNTIVSTALTPIAAHSILCNPQNSIELPVACNTLPPGFSVSTVNGTTFPATGAANLVPITTAPSTVAWETMPECLDTGGNHLNYNNATQQIFCGDTSSGGGGTPTTISSLTTNLIFGPELFADNPKYGTWAPLTDVSGSVLMALGDCALQGGGKIEVPPGINMVNAPITESASGCRLESTGPQNLATNWNTVLKATSSFGTNYPGQAVLSIIPTDAQAANPKTQLFNDDIWGIAVDCNYSASIGVLIEQVSRSFFRTAAGHCMGQADIWLTSHSGTGMLGTQDNDIWLYGDNSQNGNGNTETAILLDGDRFTTGSTTFNVSLNRIHLQQAEVDIGDGIVMGAQDHNSIDESRVFVARPLISTGRPFVIANSAYTPPSTYPVSPDVPGLDTGLQMRNTNEPVAILGYTTGATWTPVGTPTWTPITLANSPQIATTTLDATWNTYNLTFNNATVSNLLYLATNPSETGQFFVRAEQNAGGGVPTFVANGWAAHTYTGFTPNSPSTAQLSYATGAGPTTTFQAENNNIGVYMQASDWSSGSPNGKFMFAPETLLAGASPFTNLSGTLKSTMKLQVPTATNGGANPFINADFLFTGPGGLPFTFNVGLFALSGTAALSASNDLGNTGDWIFVSPLLTSAPYSTYVTSTGAGTYATSEFSGLTTYNFTVSAAQFTAALNYMAAQTITGTLVTNAATLANQVTLTFASTAGLVVGMGVTGTNIPAGDTIASIQTNGTTIHLATAVTTGGVANGATITFSAAPGAGNPFTGNALLAGQWTLTEVHLNAEFKMAALDTTTLGWSMQAWNVSNNAKTAYYLQQPTAVGAATLSAITPAIIPGEVFNCSYNGGLGPTTSGVQLNAPIYSVQAGGSPPTITLGQPITGNTSKNSPLGTTCTASSAPTNILPHGGAYSVVYCASTMPTFCSTYSSGFVADTWYLKANSGTGYLEKNVAATNTGGSGATAYGTVPFQALSLAYIGAPSDGDEYTFTAPTPNQGVSVKEVDSANAKVLGFGEPGTYFITGYEHQFNQYVYLPAGTTMNDTCQIQVGPCNLVQSSTTVDPTITSGLGTAPQCSVCNSTRAFEVITGATGTPSTTVVFGMPQALNRWDCDITDETTNTITGRPTAQTSTSVTFTMSAAPNNADALTVRCQAL